VQCAAQCFRWRLGLAELRLPVQTTSRASLLLGCTFTRACMHVQEQGRQCENHTKAITERHHTQQLQTQTTPPPSHTHTHTHTHALNILQPFSTRLPRTQAHTNINKVRFYIQAEYYSDVEQKKGTPYTRSSDSSISRGIADALMYLMQHGSTKSSVRQL
jgi:hypothetical protein